MKMAQLPTLYYAMKKEQRTVEGFNFKLKGVTLDVVFAIDSEPFTLLIGIKTHNFFFTVPVYRGFWVNALEDNVFYALSESAVPPGHLRPLWWCMSSVVRGALLPLAVVH